jgi:hypothetical protein
MPPPTSTDDTQGTVIDGTARSADWRQQQRAAQRPHNPRSPSTSPGAPASDFDPAAAKDFVSSLMIPASKLDDESRHTTAAPEAPDPYINTLLNGSQKRQATQELEIDASVNSAHDQQLLRLRIGVVGIPGVQSTIGIPDIAPDGRFHTTWTPAPGNGAVHFWFAVSTLHEADFPFAPGSSPHVDVTVR